MLKRIWDLFNRKFGNIPTSVVNFATVIPFLISTVSAVLWIISFFVEFNKNSVLLTFCADVRFVLFMFISVLLIYQQKKSSAEHYKDLERTKKLSRNYYEFLHSFRNKMGEFQVLKKKEPHNLQSVQLLVKELIKSALDNLCDIYFIYSEEVISGCVKMIVPTDSEITIDNACVQTFERSTHSHSGRRVIDELVNVQKVKGNTDFYEILLDSKKSVFYQADLVEFGNHLKEIGRKYENTNAEWEKYYHGTIVAPIRIANRRNPHNDKSSDYTILGFLCVDSMSTKAFSCDNQEFYTNIIKSYASLLYIVLEQYKIYLQENNHNTIFKQHKKRKKTTKGEL